MIDRLSWIPGWFLRHSPAHGPGHPRLTRLTRPALAAAALLLSLSLAACDTFQLKPGAKGIFDGVAGPGPAEAAEWSIDKFDPDKRYRGTLLIANAPWANEPVYIKLFTDNSNDVDPGVRAAAIRGLANHGSPEHVDIIAPRLADEDPGVREMAARALQRLHSPSAVEPLLIRLDPAKEPEFAVRVQAARALGQYRETRVVELLIQTLDDDNLAVTDACRSSLRTLTGQDLGLSRAAWATWYKAQETSEQVFAAGGTYMYPIYSRDRDWWEYFPFVPPPPNEQASTPAGLIPGE